MRRRNTELNNLEQMMSKSHSLRRLNASVQKRVYPDMLRHSFATQNIEQGMDLKFIKKLLGHESSKTTEIYTRVSQKDLQKFKNPFDDAYFDDG